MVNIFKNRDKKSRWKKITTLTILGIIILSNTPPAQFFLLENYSYQNQDGSFNYSEEPGKGMDLEAEQIQFKGWKKENPENPNTTLYRTFTINRGNSGNGGSILPTMTGLDFLTKLCKPKSLTNLSNGIAINTFRILPLYLTYDNSRTQNLVQRC
ncbi:MAG: hypothetical protein EOO88_59885 [Pedobacter sp.]|nr:MAG: hypothetical protein EOO88_59885 [Pedobacter sp.]